MSKLTRAWHAMKLSRRWEVKARPRRKVHRWKSAKQKRELARQRARGEA